MFNYYIIGLFVECTCLLIWFYSPLKTTLGKMFISKEISSNEDFETAIMFKNSIIGKLISCYICSSFWLALIIGCTFTLVFSLPIIFSALTWFTYPGLAYLYKSIIDKNK